MAESDSYINKLEQHYAPLIDKFDGNHRSVNWGSRQSQELRFQQFLKFDLNAQSSLLDVGCGVGALSEFLDEHNYQGHYLGVDVVAQMIDRARKKYPHHQFQQGSIFNHAEQWKSDYVVASGLFNLANQHILENTVVALFALCRRGLCFNSLSILGENSSPDEFQADPLEVKQFCLTLSPHVELVHDYLPHDFSVFIYRE